ncbi:MAG: KamA family radical SAM protein, partial [Planctomycetota bacterium]
MERSTASKTRYFTRIDQLEHLNEQEKAALRKVADRFPFRCNDYYLSLINWNDPNDPIRRIVIPNMRELKEWGRLDPSDEKAYTVIPGLEHKYNSTVLMLVSNVCEGICRYCFRKRVFMNSQQEYLRDLPAALSYLRDHTEITNVLLTGGDPFVLSTSRLEDIVRPVREIEHIRVIRIGTKVPAFSPYRIIDDPALPEMLGAYSAESRKIYVMTHFVHPRELTAAAIKAVNLLQKAGVEVANQTPLIK